MGIIVTMYDHGSMFFGLVTMYHYYICTHMNDYSPLFLPENKTNTHVQLSQSAKVVLVLHKPTIKCLTYACQVVSDLISAIVIG